MKRSLFIFFAFIVLALKSNAQVILTSFQIRPDYVTNNQLNVSNINAPTAFKFAYQLQRGILSAGGFKSGICSISVLYTEAQSGDSSIGSDPSTIVLYSKNITSSDYNNESATFLDMNASLPANKSGGKILLRYIYVDDFTQATVVNYSTTRYGIYLVPAINYGGMPEDLKQYAKENGLMPTIAKTLIYANDTTPILTVGSSIYSPNQQYRITLQTDGNVVIYKKTGTTTETGIWSTRTQNSDPKPQALFFQTDANLVLYLGNNINTTPIWNSQRYTHLGFNLTGTNAVYALQDDGNFVFYWKYTENGQEKTWVLASSDTQNGLSPHSGNLLH